MTAGGKDKSPPTGVAWRVRLNPKHRDNGEVDKLDLVDQVLRRIPHATVHEVRSTLRIVAELPLPLATVVRLVQRCRKDKPPTAENAARARMREALQNTALGLYANGLLAEKELVKFELTTDGLLLPVTPRKRRKKKGARTRTSSRQD
jgi:hypothetical protein